MKFFYLNVFKLIIEYLFSFTYLFIIERQKVMSTELGPDWRSNFDSFDLKPFAAASIGQVHAAVLVDGREVAIKIQYPGVAAGIESDVDNLMSLLKIWDVFPKGT